MVNTSSPGRAANCRASICPIDKSLKLQAPSSKLQAATFCRASLCHIDTRYWLRRYVTLTQDVVVWLLGYILKKNVDNLNYFVLFNNGPWYNVILTIKKEKDV